MVSFSTLCRKESLEAPGFHSLVEAGLEGLQLATHLLY